MLTHEQERRVIESIAQTQQLLDKELSYMAHLQKKDRVASYNLHLQRLNAMLSPDYTFNAYSQ
jgi:hypothetical protein